MDPRARIVKDEYHPHYPDREKDYTARLMLFAGWLHKYGNGILACSRSWMDEEDKRREQEIYGGHYEKV